MTLHLAAASAAALLLTPAPRLARGVQAGVNLMAGWAWWITAITLTVIVWYVAGVLRRARRGHRESTWRQIAFYLGVLSLYFAVEPPLDVLEDHLFAAHMFQHVIIRMLGPMLLALAAPLPNLVAGLPRPLRTYGLRPLTSSPVMRRIWGFLVHPFWAALIWTAAFYVWQWPAFFDVTVVHEWADDFQHLVLLVTSLFFWWMAFDPRGRPGAVPYLTRLLAVLGALFANIPIGAFITFTHRDLYPAYDLAGRIWGVSRLLDQQIGGLIMWVPGSMMIVIGALVVLSRWIRDDASRPLSHQARRRAAALKDDPS